MDDYYQRIAAMQGVVEDLARKLPGFRGYFEREDRRAADRLLRAEIVRRLEVIQRTMGDVQRRSMTERGLSEAGRWGEVDAALQLLIDRIRSAADGYAGVFDAAKVSVEGLAEAYRVDGELLVAVEQLEAELARVSDASGGELRAGFVEKVADAVTDLETLLGQRGEALRGLSEGTSAE